MRCLPTVESYIFVSMKFRGFLNYDVFVDSCGGLVSITVHSNLEFVFC